MVRVMLAVLLAGLGCSKGPSAMDVCKQIEASGVGSGCKADTPAGLGSGAKEAVVFGLTHVSGKTGQVLKFGDDDTFTRTYDAFDAAAMLAGPHRYGSKAARVFVQMNDQASAEDGAKVRGIVSALGDLQAPPPSVTAPNVAMHSAAPAASSTPPPPVEEPNTPSLVACKKLEAAGAVTNCRVSGNSAKFGDGVSAGIVSAFEDAKTFKAVSAAMAKDKDKKTAASSKALVLVMWKPESGAETDKKIRAGVDAL
jgi:hypothetical protein